MRKNQEYFWKVVAYDENTKEMTSYSSVCPEYTVKYKIGEETTPVKGKLFIFPTRKEARSFANDSQWSYKHHKILKCKVKNPVKMHHSEYIIKYTRLSSVSNLDRFWKNLKNGTYGDGRYDLDALARPVPNTILCDSCTPVEISR